MGYLPLQSLDISGLWVSANRELVWTPSPFAGDEAQLFEIRIGLVADRNERYCPRGAWDSSVSTMSTRGSVSIALPGGQSEVTTPPNLRTFCFRRKHLSQAWRLIADGGPGAIVEKDSPCDAIFKSGITSAG